MGSYLYVALDNHISKFVTFFCVTWQDLNSLQSRLEFLIEHLQKERIWPVFKLCMTWWDGMGFLPEGSDYWRFQRRWAPGSACSRTSRDVKFYHLMAPLLKPEWHSIKCFWRPSSELQRPLNVLNSLASPVNLWPFQWRSVSVLKCFLHLWWFYFFW